MPVGVDASRLDQTSWRAYAVRIAFGGSISVAAGIIAARYGPEVGGLFLAFPAILPASLTLVKRHDGRQAARHSASGAVAGSVGLIAFGLVVWRLAAVLPAWLTLTCASAAWLLVSLLAWLLLSWYVAHEESGAAGDRENTPN